MHPSRWFAAPLLAVCASLVVACGSSDSTSPPPANASGGSGQGQGGNPSTNGGGSSQPVGGSGSGTAGAPSSAEAKVIATAPAPVKDLVTDGTNVYFLCDNGQNVFAAPVTGSTFTTFATGTKPTSVAVGGGAVYWSDDGDAATTINRANPDGSGATVLATVTGGVQGVVASGTNVFYVGSADGSLYSVPASGAPTLVGTPAGFAGEIVASNAAGVVVGGLQGAGTAIAYLPFDGSGAVQLTSIPIGMGDLRHGDASDAAFVYALEVGGKYALDSLPLTAGGTATTIVSRDNAIDYPVVSGSTYYFTDSSSSSGIFSTDASGSVTSYLGGGNPTNLRLTPDGATFVWADGDSKRLYAKAK